MKVSRMIEFLQELPADMDFVLSKFFRMGENEDNLYEVILDSPIVGIMSNEEDNEVRLLLDYDIKNMERYGQIILLEEGQEQ